LALLEAGDAEKASRKFLQAAIADPEKWCETCIEIARLGNPDLGLASLQSILPLTKSNLVLGGVWCGIGSILHNMGQREPAYDAYKKAWDYYPAPGPASNRALIHLFNNEIGDAEHWINRAMKMNPWMVEGQFVQAMITMVGRGLYRDGFRQYECRWRAGDKGDIGLKKAPSHKPEWPGPECKDGTLLVYGEQGQGDIILCLRYAYLIRELGLRQEWIVQPGLVTLAESMGIIDKVHANTILAPEHDWHIPTLSLPRVFGTMLETIPFPEGNYIPKPASVRNRQFGMPLRIGIAWGGSNVNRNNSIRCAPLENWKPLFDLTGVEWHSLQVDGAEEAAAFPQIIQHEKPASWLETAQRIMALDLVISVDTGLVHLCGAIGFPCWVPLHCRPYFVYPLMRADCPWYSSLKLFKQKQEHQWREVFSEIAFELLRIIGNTRSI